MSTFLFVGKLTGQGTQRTGGELERGIGLRARVFHCPVDGSNQVLTGLAVTLPSSLSWAEMSISKTDMNGRLTGRPLQLVQKWMF